MKKITELILAILMLLGAPMVAHAQGWTRTIDKLPTETAVKMTATATGHLIASHGTGTYSLLSVDTLGHELWYKRFNTPANVSVKKIVTLSTGEVVLMGIISNPVPNTPGSIYLAKHDANGNQLWFKTYFQVNAGSNGYDMLVLPNDTLLIGGHKLNTALTPQESEALLYKLTADGDSVKMQVFADADTLNTEIHNITLGQNNTIVICGKTGLESSNVVTAAYDFDLNPLWQEHAVLGAVNEIIIPRSLTATSDGGQLLTGYHFITGGANGLEGYAFLYKTSNTGTIQWFKSFHLAGDLSNGQAVIEYTPGKYALLAVGLYNTGGNIYYSGKPYLVFIDGAGNREFHKVYSGSTYISIIAANDMLQLADKGFLMCGSVGQGIPDEDFYLIRTDSLGNLYKAVIMGNVFGDANENCQADSSETSLKNWIVTATSAIDSFFGVTDALGNYSLQADTGTYVLKALVPSPYWVDTLCSSSLVATVLPTTDTLTQNIPVGKTLDCPAMQVMVDAVFLRRCLPGPAYVVNYCNNGTAEAANAYVEVSLDNYLLLDSASIAFTNLGNNQYRFNLGTVGISDCGSFLMYIRADCNMQVFNQTHCIEAHIFPNATCLPPNPLWDSARLDLTTDCQPDSLAFLLTNTGGNMSVPKSFTIIQDDVMYAQGNFQLNSGQTLVQKVPSNGATWTFVTEQTPFFPGNSRLLASVEACGLNSSGNFSLGFLVQYPQIGPDPTSAQLCLIDRAAYDPNDKAAEPKGLGMEGTIDKNQELNYRIRFQNTGTDTAFLVVILDTLSDNLDLLSIRNVRSSHNMQMSILPGRILQFAFANILLPDSNVNEAASHGFVSFEIDLANDLPIGTEITNTAFIYFDQNPAVVTNTTLNTIGELFKTWLAVTELYTLENQVSLYPNPTQGLLNLQIAGAVTQPVTFSVFDLSGKLLHQIVLPAGNNHQVLLDLQQGMYLFEINSGGQRLGAGKLVAH